MQKLIINSFFWHRNTNYAMKLVILVPGTGLSFTTSSKKHYMLNTEAAFSFSRSSLKRQNN
jgi:hypothetical protein